MKLFNKVEFSKQDAIDFLTSIGFDIDFEKNLFALDAVLKTDGYARKYFSESFAKHIGGDQKSLVEANSTPLCVGIVLFTIGFNNFFKLVWIFKLLRN